EYRGLVEDLPAAGVHIEGAVDIPQTLAEHSRETPRRALLRRSAVEPAETPAGHVGSLRLGHQIVKITHDCTRLRLNASLARRRSFPRWARMRTVRDPHPWVGLPVRDGADQAPDISLIWTPALSKGSSAARGASFVVTRC